MANSIAKECSNLKADYEECFNKWFSEHFLKGRTHDPCERLYANYQKCLKVALESHNVDLWQLERNILDSDSNSETSQPSGRSGPTSHQSSRSDGTKRESHAHR